MPGNIFGEHLNKIVVPSVVNNNSLLSVLKRDGGIAFSCIKRLTLTGAQQINIFKLICCLTINSITGVIIDASSLTDCTKIYFNLWDGTNKVDITKQDGADLSGMGVNSSFFKTETVVNALQVVDSSAASCLEISGKEIFSSFTVNQKLNTDTFIRFGYTAGAAIDVTILFLAITKIPDAVSRLISV